MRLNMCFYTPRLRSPQNSLNKFGTNFLRELTKNKHFRPKGLLNKISREFFSSDVYLNVFICSNSGDIKQSTQKDTLLVLHHYWYNSLGSEDEKLWKLRKTRLSTLSQLTSPFLLPTATEDPGFELTWPLKKVLWGGSSLLTVPFSCRSTVSHGDMSSSFLVRFRCSDIPKAWTL